MDYIVTGDWTASYADPIRLSPGERVRLSGREDVWEGHRWLWATATDGREGWIPDTLVFEEGGIHMARAEYSAIELTCVAGQVLEGLQEQHGWVFCRAADGGTGWVPRRHLVVSEG